MRIGKQSAKSEFRRQQTTLNTAACAHCLCRHAATAEEVQKILEEAELKHEIPVQPEKKHEDAPPVVAGWTCTCGKTHPAYEYACVCGVTKAQAKAAQGKLNRDQ